MNSKVQAATQPTRRVVKVGREGAGDRFRAIVGVRKRCSAGPVGSDRVNWSVEMRVMVLHRGDSSCPDEHEIQRLVTTAGADGEPDDYTGQRCATRFAVGMQLDVTTDPSFPGSTWPVIMHNISEGGFAFWSKRQLRQGATIFVREFSSDNSAPWLPAHVTHCTVGIKGYLVGASFGPTP